MQPVTGTAVPPDLARDLLDAFAARDAEVVRVELDPPKTYLWARSATEELFAWQSAEPGSEAIVDYEVAVRAAVGTEGSLRAPPILARGRNWRLEPAVGEAPLGERDVVEAVAAAATRLAELELPAAPRGLGRERMNSKLLRRVRLLRAPLPLSDLVRARALLAASPLPTTTSHGDFHRRHILFSGGVLWVVDWEFAGRRPAGYDLMTLWADLEDEGDRHLLFELCVEMVGAECRRELLKLRYALLVRIIGDMLVADDDAHDPTAVPGLLALLPGVRADAGD